MTRTIAGWSAASSMTGGVAADARVPRLRGVSHAVAFFLAAVAGLRAIALAPAGRATVAVSIYGVGLVALFGVSALYHRWPAPGSIKTALQRLDHSTIFVFIAASYTPIALLVLHGALAWVILGIAWAGAAAGVTLSLGWIDAPRRVIACSYLALGWVAVLALPELLARLGPEPLALLAGGGLLYSAGAVVYARQRPNPWPRWFGFHEIFHSLVILAAAAQYIALVVWVLPSAGA
jgi:hemolysin III